MNTPSLHALIIDRHLGELSPEVAELLDTHLAQNAGARAEAERLQQTLAVTRQAVLLHPELARVGATDSATPRRESTAWLAKAAAIALLAGLAGAGGFFAARQPDIATSATPTVVPSTLPQPPRKDSPWARYRVAPGGTGLQVVRVDGPTANSR